MSELLVKEKQVVVPGQVLAIGLDYLPGQGAYRYQENILASKVGLVALQGRAIKLISLAGIYVPKENDIIVGKVTDVSLNGWRIDTNTPYSAMISTKNIQTGYVSRDADLTEILALEDWVVASIVKVRRNLNMIDASLYGPGLRKLSSGQIINVNAMKVPRIIGKQGSMVSMIKEYTGCQIVVGQNGIIWMRGTPEAEIVAMKTIYMICDLAHTPGLTERVKNYLQESCKDLDLSAAPTYDDESGEHREERREYSFQQREDRGDNMDRPDRGERRGGFRDRDGQRGGFRRGGGGFNNRRRFGGNGGNRRGDS